MHYFALIVDDQVPTEKRIEELMYPYYELGCSFDREEMKKDPRCEFVPKYSVRIAQALMVIHNKKFFECMKEYRNKNDEKSIETYAWYNKHIYSDENEFMEKYEDLELVGDQWGLYTNPQRFWDWYRIGGRWSHLIQAKKGISMPPSYEWEYSEKGRPEGFDIAQKKDVTNLDKLIPYTLITNGKVFLRETWDGEHFITNEDHDQNVREILQNTNENDYITIVDYHT